MRFALIDQTAGGGPFKITPDVLKTMADALNEHLARDVNVAVDSRGQGWGGSDLVIVADGINAGEVGVYFVVSFPDPGAVAFHTVEGRSFPACYVATSMCQNLYADSRSVSCATGHEIDECKIDPDCNAWVDDSKGTEYAKEICDPCESDTYMINGVAVPNFVLPSFWALDPQDGSPPVQGPFSYLGTVGLDPVPRPYALAPGGYQVQRPAASGGQAVFGETIAVPHYDYSVGRWREKCDLKGGFKYSRLARRLNGSRLPTVRPPPMIRDA